MAPVYLDNNATTRTDADVVAAMLPYLTDVFANASSAHPAGEEAAEAVHAARRQVARLIGAGSEAEIVFTSGATEANNAVLLSALARDPERNEIIVSAVEHAAILTLCDYLERERGAVVHRIGVDGKGRLDMAAYEAALGPKTALASIMWANNETGTIFPIAALAEKAHQEGALFHSDAVQAVGKLAVDVKAAGIDMLSLSAHKFHGPKGAGAIYLKKGVKFVPLIRGGHQERGRRGGTTNVPGVIGMGKAAELAAARLATQTAKIAALRDAFEAAVRGRIDDCFIMGDVENRLANTSSIAFDYADGEALLAYLGRAGIYVSSGSACAAGSTEPSHVVRAMKVPFTAAHGVIRFSFSHESSEEDIAGVIAVLPGAVAKARAASPFKKASADTAERVLV